MSERTQDGVVNTFGQAHDVPNLSGYEGPSVHLGGYLHRGAIRQAEYIAEQLRSQAIPIGHQVWNGRDPGGSVPATSGMAA